MIHRQDHLESARRDPARPRGSGHGVSPTSGATPPTTWGPASAHAWRERVVGATALALATSFLVQNVVAAWVAAPAFGDPIATVFAFHAQHRAAVAVVVGLESLNLLLLLGFAAGLHGLVRRRGGRGQEWSRFGLAAAATLGAVYVLYAVLWTGVLLAAGELAEPGPAFVLTWQMHAAAYALTFPALGATFLGAGLAANSSLLTPPWQRLIALVGTALSVAAGAFVVPIADGSPLLFVGLVGFALWLVWLLATGVRLVRAASDGLPMSSTTPRGA